jgi:DnaJ-domain-containing protein 1
MGSTAGLPRTPHEYLQVTLGEKIIILVGLAAGYWLVSAIMDWSARKERAEAAQTKSSQPGKQENIAPKSTSEALLPNPAGGEPHWYEVLEVPESATAEQISSAYKRKISEYRPDKVAQMGAEIRALAELRSKQINAAYDRALKLKA